MKDFNELEEIQNFEQKLERIENDNYKEGAPENFKPTNEELQALENLNGEYKLY